VSTIHLLLVSNQPTPNITPVIDPEMKPKEVILLISPDMKERAQWLTEVLRPSGVKVSQRAIENAWDIEQVREEVLNLVAEYDGREVALNVTGGTKPMAIAAYEVFRAADLPIFYVHPELDRVIWMHPADRPNRDLATRLKLDAFLKAHGVQMERREAAFGVTESQRRVTDGLIRGLPGYGQALATLNWAAARAQSTLESPDISQSIWNSPDFTNVFGWFENEGMTQRRGNRIVFADDASRFFANGGWLEQHVFAMAQKLKAENARVQDIGRGLDVTRQMLNGQIRTKQPPAKAGGFVLRTESPDTRRLNDASNRVPFGNDRWG
jgi:hypothetical protein